MGLMVGLMRCLLVCAVMLVLPGMTDAQCVSQLTVERVWTQDASGIEKTSFAPGETLQFVAELNNAYGAYMLGANGAHLIITTSFYNDTKPIDIPPGISTWTWNVTAPSTEGNYTVTVKVYDHFCGVFPEGSASFSVGSGSVPTVILDWVRTYSGETDDVQEQTIFAPGEAIRYNAQVTNPGSSTVTAGLNYRVTGPKEILTVTGDVSTPPGSWWHFVDSTVPTDAPSGTYTLQVTMTYNGQTSIQESSFTVLAGSGQPSVTYSGPFTNTTFDVHGNVVIYLNIGTDNTLSGYINFTEPPGDSNILCGAGDLSGSKQENSVEFSFTSRDPDSGCGFDWGWNFTVTGTLSEGGQIFEGNYFIDNGQQGFFRVTAQPVYVTETPQGLAPNLIVLVHGCCTDENDVKEWDELGRLIAGAIIRTPHPEAWEIVVWDWTKCTSDPNIECTPKLGLDFQDVARIAYDNALSQGPILANVIANHPYEHVHLISHSAGAKLIQRAAEELVLVYKFYNEDTFIHLTFLDAYTRDDLDRLTYGFLANYPNHYSEHYVDIGLPSTDAILSNAFNFDITSWTPDKDDRLLPFPEFGHQWPRRWYQKSVTTSGFKYGFPLSLEGRGGIDRFNELVDKWPASDPPQPCILENETTENPPFCNFTSIPPPPLPTPVPTPPGP